MQNHNARLPTMRNQGLSMAEERSHFQPSAKKWTGKRKAATPKICRSRSDHLAPNSPKRVCVRDTPVAVSQEGSAGEEESKLSATARPSRHNKIPTASFSRECRDRESTFIRRYGRKLPERSLLCQKDCGTTRKRIACCAARTSERTQSPGYRRSRLPGCLIRREPAFQGECRQPYGDRERLLQQRLQWREQKARRKSALTPHGRAGETGRPRS